MANRKRKTVAKKREAQMDALLDELLGVLDGCECDADVKIEINIVDGEGEVCVEELSA